MSKRIVYRPAGQILDLSGKPRLQVGVEDVNGEPVWEVEPDPAAPPGSAAALGKRKMEKADTYGLLREICRALDQMPSIHKKDDASRMQGIFNAIEQAQERVAKLQADGVALSEIEQARDMLLGDKSYAWLHSMLQRLCPMTKEGLERNKDAKEKGLPVEEVLEFVWLLFRGNASLYQGYLRDPGDAEGAPLVD